MQLIPTKYGIKENDRISIERRSSQSGDKWVIKMLAEVMNKDGNWEYEPLPSGRDEEFIERTRYDSPEEALTHYEKNQNSI